ncbi:MAG TPA: hypothetical protein VMZ31_04960 [Phycisphaerae bacterium]|nr:hypothetical protein [Phycisphaerae bacterium]
MIRSITALFGFSVRQTVFSLRIWVTLLLLAAPSGLTLLARYFESAARLQAVWERYHGCMQYLMFMLVIPLVCMLHGTAMIGTEAEGGTLVYLLTRRLRRAVVLLVRFAATALVLVLLLEAATCVHHLCAVGGVDIESLGGPRQSSSGAPWRPAGELAAYLCVVPMGVVSYLAVFTLIGLAAKRPITVSIIYLAAIDLAVGSLPVGARMYTISDQLRRTMLDAMPKLAGLYNLPGDLHALLYPPGSTGTGALVFVTLVALLLSCVLITVRELAAAELARE